MVEAGTARQTATQASCVHHWIIESPSGRESQGVCRNCGKAKTFANSTENVMWEQTNTLRNDLRGSLRIPNAKDDVTLSDEA